MAAPSKPLHLLGLPTELRLRIYELVFKGDTHLLAHLCLPPLVATCHQIRKEALPVFFQQTTFLIHVAADLNARDAQARGYADWHLLSSPCAGVVEIPQRALQMLHAHKDVAVLWRLATRIYYYNRIGDVLRLIQKPFLSESRWKKLGYDQLGDSYGIGLDGEISKMVAHFEFDWNGRTLRAEAFAGKMYSWHIPGALDRSADSFIVQDALQMARRLITREDFRGFTLESIKELAMAFRYAREDDSESDQDDDPGSGDEPNNDDEAGDLDE